MSVLAHPVTLPAFPAPRPRRHLWVVPSPVVPNPVVPNPVAPEEERVSKAAGADLSTLAPTRPVVAQAEPLRLSVRGKRVLVALAFAVAATVGAVAGTAASASGSSAPQTEVVTVAQGDSLWSIAVAVTGPGEDVRDVVSQIAALNDLEGTTLVAGQSLRVPTEG